MFRKKNKLLQERRTDEIRKRELQTPIMQKIVRYIAISMSLFHLYAAAFSPPETIIYRSIHVTFALLLGFILFPATKRRTKKVPLYDIFFAIIPLGSMMYILMDYERIAYRLLFTDPLTIWDYFFGSILVVLILELTRRAMGWPLVIVTLVFITHTLFGQYFPGIFRHTGVSFEMFVEHLYLTTEGLWGMPVGVSATYVFLFILLGSLLDSTGAGNYFMNLATTVTKKLRGGPAKAAIVASSLFGSISGSAVANVYGTGIFTIKLMKSKGFSGRFAGAVEAVASSGGAILPPVMGSSAFLMADFLGISYLEIMKAAIIPAILYYICLWMIVHKRSVKLGFEKDKTRNKNVFKLFINGAHLILPLIVLTVLLLNKFTPFFAAFWAICTLVGVSYLRSDSRMSFSSLLGALENGGRRSIAIASALACAAIVVGLINLTGLGLKFTALIVEISGGNILVVLLLTMVMTLILGMGLPTPAAYLIAAIFAPSAMISLGIPPLAAHMFVFYYAAMSTLTPPVAMAAYAAADIARSDTNKTSIVALRLAVLAYVIPWIFVFTPELMLEGEIITIIVVFISAVLGVYALASGIEGVLNNRVNILQRIILILSSILLIQPGIIGDLVGASIFFTLFFFQRRVTKGLPSLKNKEEYQQ